MEKFAGKPIDFTDVSITGGFWKEKYDMVKNVTIDAVYERFDETGRFDALKCDWKEGMDHRPHIFWESDITKWIEGAAYFLQKERNPRLEEKIDVLVDRMEKYQDEDGYLNVYFTVVEPEARFKRRTDHELYCAGHLVEGAIAYYHATGKRKMLDVAIRYIDLIDRVFRIEHSAAFDTPGHEEIELALVKLYHETGEERYKLLAEYFVNTRGTSKRDATYDFADQEHMQSHIPVRDQKTAEGHSVRALYLYSGMADLAMENREDELADICDTLFKNITEKRMYITGGIGSTCRGESFTFDYDLPEYTSYNETCASIALALFCRRMWLINEDSKYADCAERAIYNTVLGGVSLSGDEFFYENPMAVNPKRVEFNESRANALKEHLPILQRVKVFDCSCCPPNVVRFVGSMGDFMYSVSDDTIYAQCYMEGDAEIFLKDKKVCLSQKTDYPFNGKIEITTGTKGDYALALRIPEWCENYRLMVNGKSVDTEERNGFAIVRRSWEEGDETVLDLDMEICLMEGNPRSTDLCGKTAVMRGPLVYCAEAADNKDVHLRDIRLGNVSGFTLENREIAGIKLPVMVGKAMKQKEFDALYRPYQKELQEIPLVLIPYFAWANRGPGEMTVWFLGL